jgi:diguanylate cyclase (GGDEF)-like protein
MCDIDHLKSINDHSGHADGDEVLRRAARLLRSAFRVEDVVARIGGDEFVVVLPHTHAEGAAEAMRRVSALIDLDNIKSPPPPVLISLGIATAQNRDQLDEAIKKADAAMYLEKQTHRRLMAQVSEKSTLPVQSFSE